MKNIIPNLRQGDTYAVQTGEYVGELLIYIKTNYLDLCFLSVPKNINRDIPIDSFNLAKDNNIIEYVELLPVDVIDISIKQYEKNKISNI